MKHQAITLGRRALLAGAALAATPARAQWAPPRQVRLVVPFTPAGGADTTARLFAPSFSSFLGQPAVVENRPGGGGTIGAQEVARAAPDGTTLLVDAANQAVAPFIFRNLAFDYATAFTPISRVTVYPLILVVKAGQQADLAGGAAGPGAGGAGAAELFLLGQCHLQPHRHRPAGQPGQGGADPCALSWRRAGAAGGAVGRCRFRLRHRRLRRGAGAARAAAGAGRVHRAAGGDAARCGDRRRARLPRLRPGGVERGLWPGRPAGRGGGAHPCRLPARRWPMPGCSSGWRRWAPSASAPTRRISRRS